MASVISGMISSCTSDKRKKAKGKVVLRFADACAAAVNQIQDFLCHKKVELLLVSATVGDPNNGNRGMLGPAAYLESQMLPFDPNGMTGEMTYGVTFTVVDGHGIPGAIIVKNHHATQFYLKSVTIDNFPGEARIHFDCNSWVYNTQKYSYDRIFFANNSYLPKKTPEALRVYRQDELRNLRGDGVNRKLEEWDRIYSYGLYNDLGNPDRCLTLARPVLGGSAHLPYPRRCKTGRPPTKTDSNSESLSFLLDQKMYVPCDEHVNQNMEGNFFAHGIKILVEYLLPSLTTIADEVPIEFDSFEGLLGLYNDSAPTNIPCVQKLLEGKNFELFKACLTPNNGQPLDAKTLDMFKSIKPTSYIDVHDKFLNPFKVNHTLSINDPHYDMNSLELSKGNPLITKNDKPVEKKLLGLASNNEQSNEPKPSQSFKTTMMPDSNKCHDINSSGSLKPKFNSIINQNITDDTSPSKTSKPIQSPNNNDLIDNPLKSFNMITSPSQRQSFVTNSLEHSKVIPTKLIKDITKPNVRKNHKEKHIDSHNSSCIPIISQTHEDKSLKPTKVDHSFNNERAFKTKPSNSYKSIPMQNCNDCNDEKSSKLLKANVSPNNDQPNMNKLLEPSKTCNTSSKTIYLNVTTPLDTSDVHNMPRNDSDIEANLSMPFNYISTPNIDHPPADNSFETLYSTIPPHINDCNEVKTSKLSEIFPTPNNVIKEGNHTSEPSKDLHMLNPCHLPEFIDTLDPCKILQNNFFKFPTPKVIQEDLWAWRTDEEFAREILAGVNPVIIRRLREFPPTSKLDSKRFGDQNSRIKAELVEMNLDGLSAEQAVEQNRVFVVDHHDMIMPYLRRINSCAERAIYATRTFLFLKDDGTLKPLAIELSLPHPDGDSYGVISSVYTPAGSGVEASIWSLAKTYAIVNDSGAHQLITHWLRTHAAMEPFAIAANRQLSVMHPISKLLRPHLGDIISTNAIYRQALMNAGGLLEFTGFPGKHSMEMSAAAYRSWNFVEQGLPQDLLKRGMAVEDSSRPHNLRLLIADYPYAVDGLEIWSAVESWVREYCDAYYADEGEVQGDEEVQAWWKEARDVGHCDLKNEPWWPQMKSVADLASACTTIIWVASAMHQAVSLGQYDYAGYVPNRPTITRRFMPAQGSPEYEQLKANPEKVFLQTITSQPHAILGITLIRMLSAHDSCMPQPATNERTTEREFPLQAFNRFRSELTRIQKRIQDLNADPGQKNRTGPAKMPYTLLSPHSLTRIADSLIQSDGRD